jgi:hypothetical protein
MATLKDANLDLEVGERLRERAQREVDLLKYMLQNADAATWAATASMGHMPPAGDWAIAMNQHRHKRAATKPEAAEIIQRARRFYGSGEALIEFLEHALVDPAWALRNMRAVTESIAEEMVI